jgi:hypothetical protein
LPFELLEAAHWGDRPFIICKEWGQIDSGWGTSRLTPGSRLDCGVVHGTSLGDVHFKED